jgi:type IV pilus assembly protein PilC
MKDHWPGPSRATFRWSARDPLGRLQKGTLQAMNADLARAQLRRQGLQGIRIERLWWTATQKIQSKDLASMSRQWAALLKAGVPMVETLGMLCRSTKNKSLDHVMRAVLTDVESGVALHNALARHDRHFSGLFVHIVQAGESAGILDVMMERLAQTLEKMRPCAPRSALHSCTRLRSC